MAHELFVTNKFANKIWEMGNKEIIIHMKQTKENKRLQVFLKEFVQLK